jgi:putative thioredoxin
VTALLAAIDPRSPESERAELVAQVLAFFQAGDEEGGPAAAQARLQASEGDSAARYTVAAAQARSGQLAEALENLLTLIQRDRRYREDGARRALLALFQYLGQATGSQQELIHECRRRLQLLL